MVTNQVPDAPASGLEEPPSRGLHLYSAGGVSRANVVSLLALLAAILAAIATLLFPHLSPGAAAVAGVALGFVLTAVIFAGFETYVWRLYVRPWYGRWRVTRWFARWSTMPNLTGQWVGHLMITKGQGGDAVGEPLDCEVVIKQNWSRISIELTTEVSESWSLMATIDPRLEGAGFRHDLHFEYYVTPNEQARENQDLAGLAATIAKGDPHHGTARLRLGPGQWPRTTPNALTGIWYNDQHFQRWGRIEIRRK